MPYKGHKSITITEPVYNRYFKYYDEKRDELRRKGITSFSGYITSILEEVMERDEVFARYAPFIEEIAVELNTIILRDNKVDRIAEVVFKEKEFYCRLCEKSDCIHVGFAYSIPRVYPLMVELGVKPPKFRE